ncbi:Membrane transport protein [Labrenzia sp. THAF82]|uniref:AEC family transporter n=1 Tax=Labrenzia sp. THAF82 TaxID=2587861 RepID=UPI0012683330|nr:AEC family transporter [Labrenzia sp. THAF82]QFT29187.1 Membrane transport protein [Labrenzia sp. THAF82]
MLAQNFAIVAPVFLLIGIGYALARFKVLAQTVSEALGQFVYVVAIPILIFRTLTNADLSAGFPFELWAAYFVGVGVAWALGTLVIRKGFGRDARAGAIGGISAAFANTVLVGLPLVAAVYGDEGLVPLLLVISVHLAIMTVAMAIVMERAAAIDSGEPLPPLGRLLSGALKSLMKNPIVVTIVLAFFWRLTGFDLPEIGQDVLNRIAATALPLALLSLGMSLVQYGMRGNVLPGVLLSVIKILIMPGVVFAVSAFVFQLPPLWTAVATLTAGCPTGINAYIFANRYGTGHAMSANAITMTTLCAIVTTSLWIGFLEIWFKLS